MNKDLNDIMNKLDHTVTPLSEEALEDVAGGVDRGFRVDRDPNTGLSRTNSVQGKCAVDSVD